MPALLAAPLIANAADAQVAAFADDVDPVVAGSTYAYTLRVDNNSIEVARNVRARVAVTGAASFVSASPAAPCQALSPTQVECLVGDVPALGAGPRVFVLTWTALGPGLTTVSARAEVLSDNDTNPANNVQTETTTVVPGADLSLQMTASGPTAISGGRVSYTLVVRNDTGPNASGSIVLTDNLPPGTAFESATGQGWSCSALGSVVTCTRTGPDAPGSAMPPVTLVARVTAASGTLTNSASVVPAGIAQGGIADPNLANNQATVNVNVLPGADVRVLQKTVLTRVPASPSSNVSFQVQTRNDGPSVATDVTLTDPLPPGWQFVSATGTGWTCSGSGTNVTCTRPNLPVGVQSDIVIVATAPPLAAVLPTGRGYRNTASIAAATADPDTTNNSGSVEIQVLPGGADLQITKTKTPNPVAVGSTMESQIFVNNNGPRIATGPLRVIEQLSGERFVSAAGDGWTCVATGSTVVCDHPNTGGLGPSFLLPTLRITTIATAAGVASNTACTGSSVPPGATGVAARPPLEGDPNPSNDCTTATSTATSVRPDLAISKVTSTPIGGDKLLSSAEAAVTYTLTVSNVSPGTDGATGIVVTDVVPAFIAGRTAIVTPVVATSSAGSTAALSCSVADATVRCVQTAGVLLRGQTITIPITVRRPLLEGAWTNTATVSNSVEGDPNPANNTASDVVTIAATADVELTAKSVTPLAVRAGEPATYVISFANNGPGVATGVVVTDRMAFPAGDAGATVVFVASSAPGSTCDVQSGDKLDLSRPAFSCAIGTMENGAVQSITLVVRPNFQPGNPARIFGNTASITTTSVENPNGGDNGNNSKSASLRVDPVSVDLLVNKTDLADPVPFGTAGASLNYRVRVTSNGPSFATGVHVVEAMKPPAGKRVRFVCDTVDFAGTACNAPSLCSATDLVSQPGQPLPEFKCSVPAGSAALGLAVGELAPGQSKDIFLRFQAIDQPAPNGDVFDNLATVSANEPDAFPANNAEGESTTTRQRIDLAVSKVASRPVVSLLEPFTWTVAVVNNGPGTSVSTEVTDQLPAGVELTTATVRWRLDAPAVGEGDCSVAGQTITCAMGTLAPGVSAKVLIPVRTRAIPAGGALTNAASVNVDPAKTGALDTDPTNNTASSTVQVVKSSLTGTIFEDRDRTGTNGGVPQAQGVEPRIAGVSIRLSGTDAYGNPVDQTVVTDAGGRYLFDNLSPAGAAGYTITESQPAGYANGPVDPPTAGPNAPGAGGTYARGGATGNSVFSAIALGADTAAGNYNFPELRQPSLSGFVYVDSNLNGARDAATDTPVAGATVRLLDAASLAVIATATTDANGAYAFAGLDPTLRYTLEQPLPVPPPVLANGPVNPGLVGGAACAPGSCVAQPRTPDARTDRIANIDLGAGLDGVQFNFGELATARVSGTVYIDRNRNGLLDALSVDGRIAGVKLSIVQGGTCAGAVVADTTTAVDGSYAFDAAVVGQTYTICETQPVGYDQGAVNPGTGGATSATDAITIAAVPVGGSTDNNFGERAGSIAGNVFADANNDGLRQAGDTGIGSVTVTLTGTDANGAPVSRTVTTAPDGTYRFDDVLAGTYTVTEQAAQPVVGGATTLNGKTTAGSSGGTATPVTTTPSAISAIALAAGVNATANDFAEILPATISGSVFLDANNNGIQNLPTDTGLGGVSITVTGTDDLGNPVNRSVTTQPDGTYTVPGLRPGSYTITEPNQPAGTTNGITTAGSAGGTATPVTTTPSAISAVVLTPGLAANGNNFAEVAPNASITGRVWLDANNNGTIDATETGISGVSVELTGTTQAGVPVTASTTTDASGNYSFSQLAPGTYAVREPTQPAGTLNGRTVAGSTGGTATTPAVTPSAITGIPLAAGQVSSANNFGEITPAQISGKVWVDLDNDGVVDAGERGLSGVSIVLTGTDDLGNPVNVTVTSGADGSYTFPNLRPGTYTLTEPNQPTGTANGQTVPGSAGGTATGPATTPSAISAIVLAAGGNAQNNNFGERTGSISGNVFADANNDGIRQAGDTGIGSVTVTLTGTDANGAPVSRTVTTAPDGTYRFDDVLAGTYTVTEQAAQPVVGGATTLNGKTTAGSSGGTATPVTTTPSAISAIALAAGVNATANDFAEILPATISGTVFLDANNNGIQNLPTDTGLGGVTITVTGTDDLGNPVNRSVTTQPDGSYSVPGLRPGSYTITEPNQPAGTTNGITTAGSAGGTATPVTTTPSAISAVVLTPGLAANGNNFAEVAPNASITGRVWLDANNNGSIDATETGISGVSVELTGTTQAGVPVTASTTTDASGNYSFSQLAPGTYAVREPTQPAGTLNGRTVAGSTGGTATTPAVTPSAITGIPLAAGQVSSANNFGEITPAQISGKVWVDLDNDGVVDAGERGLSGVSIVLTGTDDLGNPVSITVTSGPDGSYTFPNLRPGTYTLTEPNQPTGTANGQTVPGSAGGTATNPATTPSAISAIVLAAGGNAQNNNFGERTGSIAGNVFADANNDGIRQAGDTGIGGVTVTLTGTDANGAPVSRTVTTAPDGTYRFDDVLSGTYTVTEQAAQPVVGGATTLNGKTTAGSSGGTATPVTTTPSAISAIALAAGVNATANDFAEILPATISGTVFLDANNNGIQNLPTDTGLGGVTITVTGTDDLGNPVNRSVTTQPDGSYSVPGLRPGSYTITEPNQPAGTTNGITTAGSAGGTATPVTTTPSAISAVVLAPGVASSGNNFAEQPAPGAISGRVWLDANNNGAIDAGETGISGVTIELTGTTVGGAPVSLSTTTDVNGNYSFGSVAPGTYALREPTQPAGTLNGRTVPGSTGGTATGVGTTPSAITGIPLAAAGSSSANNFGEITPAQISGRVWVDLDNDGVVDAGERGLPGVSIVLTGTDDLGNPVNVTVTSGPDGSYTFPNLRPGTYTLTEPNQPTGTANGQTVPGSAGGSATGPATTPSAISAIVLAAGGNAQNNNFGERTGSISGNVFADANNDGLRQAGDTGIGSVTVTLTGTDANGAPVSRTVTTAPDGTYRFDDVLAGTYTVTEQAAQPVVGGATTLNGKTTAGSSGGTATPVTTTPSAISAIALAAGVNATANDFAEILPATISGTVFLDANNNGIQNLPTDTGLGGVTITVTGTDDLGNPVNRSVTTQPDGSYSVPGLRPGSYTITEPNQPAGTTNGITTAGSAGGTATPVTTTPSAISAVVLTPGLAANGNNFAEVAPNASITGRVWLDANNNGSIDATETGISGVSVELTGTTQAGVPVTASTTTDASGNYSFSQLAPGTYAVREPTQPAGTLNGRTVAGSTGGTATTPAVTPSAITGIPLAAGQVSSANNFGEITPAQISGKVWVDLDNDGVVDAGERGLSGVSIVLTGTDDLGNPVSITVTSGPDGSYTFPNLRPGTYTLTEPNQPTGTANGQTVPGSAGGTATNPATTPSAISAIVLAAGGNAQNNNFGERTGSIAGNVFADANNDGIRQAGDTGIGGVTVTLTGTDANGAPVSRTVTTAPDGTYRFDDVLSGTYTVTEQAAQPVVGGATTLNGKTTAGSSGGTATPVTTTPSAISAIALAAGVNATANDFAEILPATISGTVFLDANNNGIQNLPTDTGLGGVTITVTGTDDLGNPVNRSVTTQPDGSYSVPGLRPGSYTITEPNQPAGTTNGITTAGSAGGTATPVTTTPSAISAVVLAPGVASSGNNFAETSNNATIAGRVWLDANNNGVIDGGETGISGVTIELTGTSAAGQPVTASTTTDASGNYAFTGLFAGTYALREPTQPAGTGNGTTLAGSAGGTATAAAVTPSAISGIVLGAGQAANANNFGEIPLGQVTGKVWVDLNNDGVVDANERGLPGVSIVLTGTDDLGNPVNITVTSGPDGSYTFPNLRPGTYTLTEPNQPTGTANGQTVPGTAGGTATGPGTTPSAIRGLTLTPGGTAGGNNFGERTGSISGNVFVDANNDGARQAADTGIGSVTVTLSGTDANGAPVSRTTTTAPDGTYRFDDVLAGTYTVTEQAAQPVSGGATTLNGKTTAGTSGGTATPVTTTPSAISAITLAAGANATANDFAEILPSTIRGTVFNDANNNGVQDPTDSGLGGVTLVVTGTDDTGAPVNVTVTTQPDGTYTVPGLRPGTYTITEPTQPPGTSNGQTIPGSAGGIATPVTTTPSVISGVVLSPGTTTTGNNFAELPASGTVGGRVWLDSNNNGLVDGTETGIAGVPIELTGTDSAGRPVTLTTTTDANGNYSFSGLPPGTYTIRQPQQPAGTVNGATVPGSAGGTATTPAVTPSAISQVVLGAGQSATANNFAELPAGTISGSVWADNNNNGTVDAGEPGLPNVTIVLTGTDDLGNPVNVTVTTGPDGSYTFPNLRPGSYTLTEPTQPPGTSNGATVPGTAGGTATTPAVTPSVIRAITLAPGVQSSGNNFGELADSPDVVVTKTHDEARMTVGRTGTFRITVRNAGSQPTSGAYTLSDRLPAGLALAATPTGANWSCTGAAGAATFSCTSSTVIAAGTSNPDVVTAVVTVAASAAAASPVNNLVLVEGGGEIDARKPTPQERTAFDNGDPTPLPACTVPASANACRDPVIVQQTATVSGTVWYDTGSTPRVLDGSDKRLAGWTVEVFDPDTGTQIARTTSANDGTYSVQGLLPGVPLAIRFREPTSGIVFGYPVNGETSAGSSGAACVAGTPPIGTPSSCVGTGAEPRLVVVLAPGQTLGQQSLPVDPSGVVYDSISRAPVPGSVVTFAPVGACAGWTPSTHVVGANLGGYTVNGNAVSMTVGADGLYQFLLAPTAPASCTFGLSVAPTAGYTFASTAIPASAGPLVPPGAAGTVFNVQPQAGPPTGSAATTYYLAITTGSAGANVIHNHIPVDPQLPSGVSLSKTGDRAQAEVGDSVRYAITVQVTGGALPAQTTVVDRLPAGFTYIRGTATVNDVPIADPQGGLGPTLAFNLGAMPASGQAVLKYRVRVGVGAQQGDGINRARAHACAVAAGCVDGSFNPRPGSVPTNEGQFRVRVSGGVFTADACVAGNVFTDCNNNHVKDPEELGIPGVRLFMQDGTTLITDSEGKFSMCGLTPNSHVLKVDPTTLPEGSYLTTTSNRNLGDAGSVWLDLKNGQLSRAEFAVGWCSNRVIEQVKARRAQGEVRAPETEKGPALRFESKPITSPQQGTDGANQTVPKPRGTDGNTGGSDAKR